MMKTWKGPKRQLSKNFKSEPPLVPRPVTAVCPVMASVSVRQTVPRVTAVHPVQLAAFVIACLGLLTPIPQSHSSRKMV